MSDSELTGGRGGWARRIGEVVDGRRCSRNVDRPDRQPIGNWTCLHRQSRVRTHGPTIDITTLSLDVGGCDPGPAFADPWASATRSRPEYDGPNGRHERPVVDGGFGRLSQQ